MICINHSKFVCIWEVGWPPRATQNKFVFQVICAHKPLKKYRKFIWIIVEHIWKLHCPKDRRKSGPSERILPKHLKLRSHKDNFEITGEWIQTENKMSQRKNRLFNNKQCHIILPWSSTISARRTYTHTNLTVTEGTGPVCSGPRSAHLCFLSVRGESMPTIERLLPAAHKCVWGRECQYNTWQCIQGRKTHDFCSYSERTIDICW